MECRILSSVTAKHYETKGPGQIKPKRDYLTREILRYKTIHQIPFVFPKNLPFNSLYALRLSLIEDNPKKLIDLFFRASWEHGLDIGDDQVVKTLLLENGFNADMMMEQISSKEIKLKLRKNIEQALSKGVFGVPTFIVKNGAHEELFWGNDSIPMIEKYLSGNDPLPIEEYHKFLNDFPM